MGKKKESKQVGLTALQQIRQLSSIVSRISAATMLGKDTYGGDRNVYSALGYPTEIEPEDYRNRWERQDIAAAVCNAYPDATWGHGIRVTDDEDPKTESVFEKALNELDEVHFFWEKLNRLDKLLGLSRYAIMLFGLDDVENTTDFAKPVESGKRKLLYMQPYGEDKVSIQTKDSDPSSERYGKPVLYQVTVASDDGTDGGSTVISVHYTRIVHVAENLLDSSVYGVPRLQQVYNRLIDIERTAGASGEMFWRGARPGLVFKADPGATYTPQGKAEVASQIEAFTHDLTRVLRLIGIDVQELQPQVEDPSKVVDVQLSLISAIMRIPKRILVGSERGELASSQDERAWADAVMRRMVTFAEPHILRPMIDRLIVYGVLPIPKNNRYMVEWPDLRPKSRKDEAEIAKMETEAIARYAGTPGADAIMPVDYFLRYILGWSQDRVDSVMERIGEIFNEVIE